MKRVEREELHVVRVIRVLSSWPYTLKSDDDALNVDKASWLSCIAPL